VWTLLVATADELKVRRYSATIFADRGRLPSHHRTVMYTWASALLPRAET
jgi:hypothetical protein